MFAAGEEGFVEGVATYLGEAALRLAGGAWGWQEGQPVLHPDERLGLPPDWPQLQLLTAVENRDRQVFAGTLASLQQHVDALRAEDPDWTPVRQPAPSLHVISPTSSEDRDDLPTGPDPVPASGDDLLRNWLERAHLRPDRLKDLALPGDIPLDSSPVSLTRLEAEALQRCHDPRDLGGQGDNEFVAAVAAYVGEAMLRVAGGCWTWDENKTLPIVQYDERLGLPGMTPLFVLIEAVANRGGHVFAREHARLVEQVKTRQVEDPGWRPVKQATPGLDLVEPGSEQADHLTAWLAERRRVFAGWIGTYAGDVVFDHTPESLDVLEALVRGLVPAKEQLDDPALANFVEGAVWYLGEVMRRANGGEWCFQPGELDPWNPHVGRPYIQHPTDGGSTAVPILDLAFMLGTGVPGVLRDRFAEFAR